MHILTDRSGALCGYLIQSNIITDSSFDVIGVVLGQCVFNHDGKVMGRIFDNAFYSPGGEIVCRVGQRTGSVKYDKQAAIGSAWKFIQAIRDHQCGWIYPSEAWTAQNLATFMDAAEEPAGTGKETRSRHSVSH